MQVVSGSIGKEKVHYQAPSADILEKEMSVLIDYINKQDDIDYLIKIDVVHLWFVALHPFDDGNGRIARALTDMLLTRSDDTQYRFYSMSAQLLSTRKAPFSVL